MKRSICSLRCSATNGLPRVAIPAHMVASIPTAQKDPAHASLGTGSALAKTVSASGYRCWHYGASDRRGRRGGFCSCRVARCFRTFVLLMALPDCVLYGKDLVCNNNNVGGPVCERILFMLLTVITVLNCHVSTYPSRRHHPPAHPPAP